MITVLEDEERGGERSGGVLKGGQEEEMEGREDATGMNNLHQAWLSLRHRCSSDSFLTILAFYD